MPTEDGILSEAEKQVAQSWLKSKMKNLECPVCGSGHWTIGDQTVICAPVGKGGNINLGGKIVPMIQLISNDCGYVCLIMAIPMGIKF